MRLMTAAKAAKTTIVSVTADSQKTKSEIGIKM